VEGIESVASQDARTIAAVEVEHRKAQVKTTGTLLFFEHRTLPLPLLDSQGGAGDFSTESLRLVENGMPKGVA
jgi:hypothetical protein